MLKNTHYVYLLYAPNSKHYYIGYTINPLRRLRQHNGYITGGAKHTKKYRPWVLLLLITGFNDAHEALSFEWHWQHFCKGIRKLIMTNGKMQAVLGKLYAWHQEKYNKVLFFLL